MVRGHRLNTSIVQTAVHGLSGLFRAVSAVEPSLFRPLYPPPPSPSLTSNLASVDVKQHGLSKGVVLTTVTANVESFPRRYRGLVAGFVGSLWWAMVTSSLTAWVYPLRHFPWRVVQLAVTSVGLVVVLQIV